MGTVHDHSSLMIDIFHLEYIILMPPRRIINSKWDAKSTMISDANKIYSWLVLILLGDNAIMVTHTHTHTQIKREREVNNFTISLLLKNTLILYKKIQIDGET